MWILTSACGRLYGAAVGPEPGQAGAQGDGMRVTQAFRFELAPNRAGRVALAKHVGAARFAYNEPRNGDVVVYPQTRRAVSTTSLSLDHWSSSDRRLPSITEANPHWGLRARRSSGT